MAIIAQTATLRSNRRQCHLFCLLHWLALVRSSIVRCPHPSLAQRYHRHPQIRVPPPCRHHQQQPLLLCPLSPPHRHHRPPSPLRPTPHPRPPPPRKRWKSPRSARRSSKDARRPSSGSSPSSPMAPRIIGTAPWSTSCSNRIGSVATSPTIIAPPSPSGRRRPRRQTATSRPCATSVGGMPRGCTDVPRMRPRRLNGTKRRLGGETRWPWERRDIA
mmetsp:Transcript_10520/g.29555  ORF Transcript_10520/g.29555 Transcript_10520/m.29555 type:complete len:217 (-) Transcript_10520:481-1131(-)